MISDDMMLECNRIRSYQKIWSDMKRMYDINDMTATLVLAGENERLDSCALDYLPYFLKRKNVTRAVILVSDNAAKIKANSQNYSFPTNIFSVSKEELIAIYKYYCFAFNLDNIAFTFLNHCPYNLMGRILSETDITEEEAVGLGVYWLRELPEKTADV